MSDFLLLIVKFACNEMEISQIVIEHSTTFAYFLVPHHYHLLVYSHYKP